MELAVINPVKYVEWAAGFSQQDITQYRTKPYLETDIKQRVHSIMNQEEYIHRVARQGSVSFNLYINK